MASGVPGAVTYMSSLITQDTCKTDWRLLRFCGRTILVPMSCMSQVYPIPTRKTKNYVLEKVFCESNAGIWEGSGLILIRFTVYPRPRTGRRDQPAFKVKSILKGTEYEGSVWIFEIYRLPILHLFSISSGTCQPPASTDRRTETRGFVDIWHLNPV